LPAPGSARRQPQENAVPFTSFLLAHRASAARIRSILRGYKPRAVAPPAARIEVNGVAHRESQVLGQ
jgi:hypothetical protein